MLGTWALGIATAVAVGADDDVAPAGQARRLARAPRRERPLRHGLRGPRRALSGPGAAHLGLVDDAIAEFDQAVKSCTENGAEGYRAEAEYELASALVRRSNPGDLARARTWPSRRCGGPTSWACRRSGPRSNLLDRVDTDPMVALTPRELEVADLVARGLTNREIASRLFLSERTAQNHVQHILDKLDLRTGARSRCGRGAGIE